ncbi:MAG TPA: RNA polymerase sporulation sigma factor SigE [Halanaerobiaceae bacterium]|jgi:RNA polymerase sporulation-specific sigma factor|nr:RNA polymerase sporulation sigma factor SigE [Bacillota bacterium]HHU91604.1 RNA polymerase sporulation sigma factor SigE [Halanaerobiaceae bacterium]HOA40736.1 RNA polymerase sporulation sigma factor SigE [Halanaerobiales bacterium]HPZ62238.1 RNA polymerase sporulation sigma factor SigE [Halanaerobiales bacterium]HQD03606.1 RNA polymerase sporulation sigma factor SigE [Halanaerobiales bacterium]
MLKKFFLLIKVQLKITWIKLLQKIGLYRSAIYYLGSSETLPPPLEEEEESYLLERLGAGEEEVRKLLIEHNLRLVVYIARKFNNTGVDIEDLVSIGTIGLIKAVRTFDVNKNIKLATYASRCIENEILMYLRKNNRKKAELSFDDPLNIDWDGNELKLSDIMGTDADIIYKNIELEIDRELLKTAMKALTKRERTILILRFGLLKSGNTKTQKDVADILGISQSYISRLEKRIIRKLRREVAKLI